MMRMTKTDWLNLMLQVGSNPALARELLGADVTEENFIERMTTIKEKKKRALAYLRYRALKGKPMKQSEVTQMMRNFVKNQWICFVSAQYNLFRPKPAITEPPSKRQRVENASSQPDSVPTATTHTADDPDSAGGGSSNHGLPQLTQWLGFACFQSYWWTLMIHGYWTLLSPLIAAFDSAGSRREMEFHHLQILLCSTSPSNFLPLATPLSPPPPVLCVCDFTQYPLQSVHAWRIGMSRVVADPDSDDEVFAEIIFRGKSISGDGVVFVDKLPDDEIVDPRVKVYETIY
ncbi:hypothetical protein Tco_1122584 [Tanacetum coccineum]|uniref:Uncharacterized protein n=1 Tax=Tanacetum coccineum TaxID=301880 RepID=A0ABQ5J158_9ASTR